MNREILFKKQREKIMVNGYKVIIIKYGNKAIFYGE